jgi:hypothetical protein
MFTPAGALTEWPILCTSLPQAGNAMMKTDRPHYPLELSPRMTIMDAIFWYAEKATPERHHR